MADLASDSIAARLSPGEYVMGNVKSPAAPDFDMMETHLRIARAAHARGDNAAMTSSLYLLLLCASTAK